MQKIMFNDKYLLTKAVLESNKTQTRRICRIQPPYEYYDVAFPCCWIDEDNPEKDPLYGAFCWVNKITPQEHTDWVKPQFREGEVVAVAQSYRTIYDEFGLETMDMLVSGLKNSKGWNNKMFVASNLMQHQIRITNVRIQRLQDISDEDCLAEGIEFDGKAKKFYCGYNKSTNSKIWLGSTPREAYAALIDKISGKGTWDSNPWVWSYTFELVK